jgi:small basic protein (TIGR04137 family)
MTMDKSLKVRLGLTRARSVLTRDERIQRLKAADRWQEGDDPYGLPKVRVFKLTMKKKKKKKEEEGAEGAAATPAAAAEPAKKEAGKKDAGKKDAGKKKK